MKKLDNITRHLNEEIEKEKKNLIWCANHSDYVHAALLQERIATYEKAIYIVNTLF